MSFFDNLFKKKQLSAKSDLRFGRHSDIYKTTEAYDAWNKSLSLFEDKNYIVSYALFFKYLGDENEQNVKCRVEGEKLYFECYQGSKKITGEANRISLKAEAKIADARNVKEASFFRELLERNFELEYCRFALDEELNLTIVFDSPTLDGSPYKLYYALREMALQADKQDDILLERYPSLQSIDAGYVKKINEEHKAVKYEFALKEIEQTLDTIKRIEPSLENYPGGLSYLLLSLCYKLDWLLTPQGAVTETLERIHRGWFATDKKSTEEKNASIIAEFERLLKRPREIWYNEFYQVIATFGIVPAFGHERVENVIDAELPVLGWYAEHGHKEVALAIADYIIGHSLFSFAIPKYDRDLFHLYFRITNATFFADLGVTPLCYNEEKQSFDRKSIKRLIQEIAKLNEENFLSLKPDTSLLKFTNKIDFAESYLKMIKEINAVQIR